MEQIMLDCFKDFKCIADKCKDNCCIGWEIDIDEEASEFYKIVSGSIKNRLNTCISKDNPPHFILGKNERCPFLNDNNLCDIIINLGEDKIPYICKNHPRFYTWLPDRTEAGIGICCEVASKMLLSSSEKLNVDIIYTMSDNLSDVMTYCREVAFSILQNRNLSICDRLCIFLDYCEALDEDLIFQDTSALKNTANSYKTRVTYSCEDTFDITEILELFSKLAPIDNNWTKLMNSLAEKKDDLIKSLPEFRQNNQGNFYKYEHLAVYFTYRHFLNSVDDFCIAQTGDFIVLSTIFCALCDAYSLLTKGLTDTETNAKLYSKQVEYSIDNTDAVRNSNIENIKGLIPLIFGG